MTPESPNGSEQTTPRTRSDTLTTRQGHPVVDSQNLRTVGDRGPATLESYPFSAILRRPSHRDGDRRAQPLPGTRLHAAGRPHCTMAARRWC